MARVSAHLRRGRALWRVGDYDWDIARARSHDRDLAVLAGWLSWFPVLPWLLTRIHSGLLAHRFLDAEERFRSSTAAQLTFFWAAVTG